MLPPPLAGHWMATEGEYQALIEDLCASDPRLALPDVRANWPGSRWSERKFKLTILQFEPGSSDVLLRELFSSTEELRSWIDTRYSFEGAKNTVWIAESCNSGLVAMLGSHFGAQLSPSMFMEYERTLHEGSFKGNYTSILPSALATRDYICMEYRELFDLPQSLRSGFGLRCLDTGRNVSVTRINGEFSGVGVVSRKCVFWVRDRPAVGAWDCLILCDPPLVRVRRTINVAASPKDTSEVLLESAPALDGKPSGYVDFLPEHVQIALRKGPPRTSLGDDLCFYLENHSRIAEALGRPVHQAAGGDMIAALRPDTISFFVSKIVASHYTLLFHHLLKTSLSARRPMQRQSNFKHLKLSEVEAQWSDIQTLERRLSQYCRNIERILLQLPEPPDLPLEHNNTTRSGIRSWLDITADFKILHYRFDLIRQQSQSVNQSIATLVSIGGYRRALMEQQQAKVLVLIGLGFVPLAFFASIFSMAEDYLPGSGEHFWVYLAVALPSAMVVYGGYYGWEWKLRRGESDSILKGLGAERLFPLSAHHDISGHVV